MKIINALELLGEIYPDNGWFDLHEFEMENAIREWRRKNNAYWYRQNGFEQFSMEVAKRWAEKFGREKMVVSLF